MKAQLTQLGNKLAPGMRLKKSGLVYNPDNGEFTFDVNHPQTGDHVIANQIAVGYAAKFAAEMYEKYPDIMDLTYESPKPDIIAAEYVLFANKMFSQMNLG
jgi:hypothetical protein